MCTIFSNLKLKSCFPFLKISVVELHHSTFTALRKFKTGLLRIIFYEVRFKENVMPLLKRISITFYIPSF